MEDLVSRASLADIKIIHAIERYLKSKDIKPFFKNSGKRVYPLGKEGRVYLNITEGRYSLDNITREEFEQIDRIVLKHRGKSL